MNDYFKEKLEQIMKDEYQKEAYLSKENTVVIAGPESSLGELINRNKIIQVHLVNS